MNLDEEFWRCARCNEPWFFIDKKHILKKDLMKNDDFSEEAPITLKTKREIICANCGKKNTRKEFLNNE